MAGKQETQKLTRRMVLVAACIHAALLAGCADIEGEDPYAMWEVYHQQDTEELYHFSYLSPPWVFVESLDQTYQQLIAIAPTGNLTDHNMEKGHLHAKIKATVKYESLPDAPPDDGWPGAPPDDSWPGAPPDESRPDVPSIESWRDARSAANEYLDLYSPQPDAIQRERAEAFKSASGIEGYKISFASSGYYFVAVYHDVEKRGIVSMKVASEKSLDTADITLLLKSLEPGPPGEK